VLASLAVDERTACQRAWTCMARGKTFDTFAPLGPWIETDLVPDNPHS
jgi:2-keto-4-pentenoate hydratase/2-oxohepta-3-ene-1,7-dioic acid hydratase in catechol pathway